MTDKFCTYCQEIFQNPKNMHRHLFVKHPHSYATESVRNKLRGTDEYVRKGKLPYELE